VRDAGYTATDEALRIVQTQTQCKWLSVTNGDNLYGSEVFANILNTKPEGAQKKLPDFVLSPMDSRNFADQGTFMHFLLYAYDRSEVGVPGRGTSVPIILLSFIFTLSRYFSLIYSTKITVASAMP